MTSQTWEQIAILLHAPKGQTPISQWKISRFFWNFANR